MRSSIVLLATLAAALSPYAAAFAPTMPASAGRAAAPGRMALRMRSDGIFSTYNKVTMMPEPAPKPDGQPRPSIPMPMVSVGEGQMDIYSRLARDRILLLGTDVNDEVANNLVAQMLFLANEDPGRDITLYSEFPGRPDHARHNPHIVVHQQDSHVHTAFIALVKWWWRNMVSFTRSGRRATAHAAAARESQGRAAIEGEIPVTTP